jgi:4-hydroxy-tetrahydrodipicolinate reductase
MLRIAMLGATGRMGAAIVRLAAADRGRVVLSGASAAPGDPGVGQDAGTLAGLGLLGVTVTDRPAQAVAGCDVAIDFTAPAALPGHLAACRAARCGLVLGTTGLGAGETACLQEATREIPVVYARNMSVGVHVLTEAVRLVTRLIGRESDVEIVEAHHRHKADAPSGTALQLGETVAAGLGRRLEELAVYDRHDVRAARRPGSIGLSSVRAGSIVGDHEVIFALDDELVRLEHRALDRGVFARGALRAAAWLPGRAPGLYGLGDVLGTVTAPPA